MPDWSKIKRSFIVDGVEYGSFKEAQRAIGQQAREENASVLRSTIHAAAPQLAPVLLDQIVSALVTKFNFSDREALAKAARDRRAKKTDDATKAPAVAA